jgi:hypothetical protein
MATYRKPNLLQSTKRVDPLQSLVETINQQLLNATNDQYDLRYYLHQQMKIYGVNYKRSVRFKSEIFHRLPPNDRRLISKRSTLGRNAKTNSNTKYRPSNVNLTSPERRFLIYHVNELNKSSTYGSVVEFGGGKQTLKGHRPVAYLNDEERKELYNLQGIVLNTLTRSSKKDRTARQQTTKIFQRILTRRILYIGTECNRKNKINIESEYQQIRNSIDSKQLELVRVKKPTIENIMSSWDSIRPSILFFSCHGDSLGMYLLNKESRCIHIPNIDLIKFFKKRSSFTECVILSSCESYTLGEDILPYGKKIICINQQVDIETAYEFNKHFFKYLNEHYSEPAKVYRDAYFHSMEIIKYYQLIDYSSIKFIEEADVIE